MLLPSRASVRLLAGVLLASLAAGGSAAVLLDGAEAGRSTVAWEAEHHAPDCPPLHDHALCGLLQQQRWLATAAPGLLAVRITEGPLPTWGAATPTQRRCASLPLSRAPPAA